MKRSQKEDVIREMSAVFKEAKGIFVTDFRGLSVSEITKLRAEVRQAGARFRVVKNTLLTIASAETDYAELNKQFSGTTAIVTANDDPVAAAKAIKTFAKSGDKLQIRAGALGSRMLTKADVEALADLPGLDQLRATLVGLLQAPASRIMRLLKEPGSQVARVLKAHADQG